MLMEAISSPFLSLKKKQRNKLRLQVSVGDSIAVWNPPFFMLSAPSIQFAKPARMRKNLVNGLEA